MTSEAPPFWWQGPDWRAWMLFPLSAAYASAAGRRLRTAPREKVDAPVLCVGNFTVGGTGKTPVAIALAEVARAEGRKPGFLSRGHGGSHFKPHLVDPAHDSARHVGDEPLLLAEIAPTAVTRDRAAGARLLIGEGCDFLIMDDGFQSARIHIDYALIVVDARRGIGNGHVIPAGPMRARLIDQLRYADAMLEMGEGDAAQGVVRKAARAGKRIFRARASVSGGNLEGRSFLAFAGIGDPEKFFATVEGAGATVRHRRAFADHHFYTRDDLRDMTALAAADGLEIVTTAKDAMRLRHGPPATQAFLETLHILEIGVEFEPRSASAAIIHQTIDNFRGG